MSCVVGEQHVQRLDLRRSISFLTTRLAQEDGKAAATLLAVSKVTQLGESKGLSRVCSMRTLCAVLAPITSASKSRLAPTATSYFFNTGL